MGGNALFLSSSYMYSGASCHAKRRRPAGPASWSCPSYTPQIAETLRRAATLSSSTQMYSAVRRSSASTSASRRREVLAAGTIFLSSRSLRSTMSWNGLLLLNDTIPPLYRPPPVLPAVTINVFRVITLAPSLSISPQQMCIVVL